MRRARHGHQRPSERERGVALVEAAIVLPLVIALVMGIIDFGLVLSDNLSVRQGVREGARQAVVADYPGCTSGTDTSRVVCLTKQRVGVDGTSVYVRVASSPAAVGGTLVVCAATPMGSATGLFSPVLDGRHLTSSVRMRIETVSATPIATGGDPDPTGRGWSWCT